MPRKFYVIQDYLKMSKIDAVVVHLEFLGMKK